MSKFLFLDIETIPSQSAEVVAQIEAEVRPPASMSKPETIAKWNEEQRPAVVTEKWLKTSFDGARGHVVAISFTFGEGAVTNLFNWDYRNYRGEADLLKETFDTISGRCPAGFATVVGHNVAGFDLRFLFQRAAVHGIKPPPCIKWHAKPWDANILDTQILWTGSANEHVRLDELCRIFGIARKGSEIDEEIDGSMVWDFVRAGKIEKVSTYCGGDVERVREVARRLTFTKSFDTPDTLPITLPAFPVEKPTGEFA